MASKVLSIILIAIGLVAFIMCAASCGGDKWLDAKNTDFHSGLWRGCATNRFVTGCKTLEDLLDYINQLQGTNKEFPDYLKAVRAFTLIACLMLPVGCIFGVISLLTEKVKVVVASVLYLAAAICMLIAMSIFTDKEEIDSEFVKYGWSYILGWVGMITAGVGAIIGFVQ